MSEEVVSVQVHAPKKDDRATKNTLRSDGSLKSRVHHNGKPSRRWLMSEVERLVKRNSDLTTQLESRYDIEKNLMESKAKLERELVLMKSRRAVGSHEVEAVRERNKQLSQDIYLMKNILVKLNVELERYQGKLRAYERECSKEKDGDTQLSDGRRRRERVWLDGELSIFAPLVTAFDECLDEKEILIQDLREAVQNISGKLKQVITENTQLRDKMASSEKQGELTYADWVGVQREMALLNEQNLLLKRQANLSHSKISELKATFQAKLATLNHEREDSSDKLSALREEHLLLRGKHSTLEQELQRLKEETSDRIPRSVHLAYIAECKRLLDELKSRHEEERNSLLKKVMELESVGSHPSTDCRVRELEAEVTALEERCAKSDRRKAVLKSRVDGLVTFSKELIAEHESLLAGVSGELRLNIGLAQRVDQIKRQLKGVESETLEQIKLLDENISSQVDRVNRHCTRQRGEIDKLREELAAKDQLLTKGAGRLGNCS